MSNQYVVTTDIKTAPVAEPASEPAPAPAADGLSAELLDPCPRCGIYSHQAFTAADMRAAIEAERDRLRQGHAKALVEAHREAFCGNIDALSKLDLDAMDVQSLLLAVQNWDISTGRARELLRCWVLGTFKPDMLPECGDELFAEAEEPREAWAKYQAELSTLREQLAEWQALYRRAINEANGLTNYVEDRPELYSAEKRIAEIERAALAAKGEGA